MDKNLPLVSVLISTFNEEKYIADCIRSIKNQTYSNLEIILIDDASNDKTVEIVKSLFSANDRLIVNPVNIKHHECFNLLLTMASGKYIKVVMADDYLMPTSIEKSVAILESDETLALVAHARQIVDYKSRKIFDIFISKRQFKMNGREMFLKTLKSGTNIIGEPNACLFRTKDIEGEKFWDLTIIGAGELTLWFKLLMKGDFYYIPEPLCGFRISLKSASLVHAGKIAKHFIRYMKKISSEGFYIPLSVRITAYINAYIKQELRRLVYIYIKLRVKLD